MKKITFLLSIILFCSSCNDDDKNSNPVSQLPPETETGANTVGCLVNGKIFLPQAEGINPPVNCFYQFEDGEFYFTMNFADLRGFSNTRVVLQTTRVTLEAGQTYSLNMNPVDNDDYTGCGGIYSLSSINRFFTNSINTGELKITRVDLSNSIISGTFQFDAVNAAGEKVEIRQGRFDWNY